MLLRTAVFLWISVGFLSSPKKSEAGLSDDHTVYEFVFRDVCLEFVCESKTWSQARISCEKRGGKLLKMMTGPIKTFLKNVNRHRNINNFTWWLGEGVPDISEYTTFLLLVATKCVFIFKVSCWLVILKIKATSATKVKGFLELKNNNEYNSIFQIEKGTHEKKYCTTAQLHTVSCAQRKKAVGFFSNAPVLNVVLI